MKVQDNMKKVIQDKRDYYKQMLNICEDILDGTSMKDACTKQGVTVPTFRNRICKNEYKPALYSQEDVVASLAESLSPEERLLEEVFKFSSFRAIALIDYPDDFEETIQHLISEMDERTQECIDLYFFQDWTYTAIGEKLNLSMESIRKIIHKAARKLRRTDRIIRIIYGDKQYQEMISPLTAREDALAMMNAILTNAANTSDTAKLCDKMMDWLLNKRNDYIERLSHVQCEVIGIDSLDLTTRAFNSLFRAKITTINQILDMTDSELLSIRNLGSGTLQDIDIALMKKGYSRIHTRS